MYPGSLPLIFNGGVPGHEKLFNVRRCSMYTGVQFDRFHCVYIYTLYSQMSTKGARVSVIFQVFSIILYWPN